MRVRFRRLFELVVDKLCTVSFMSELGWEESGAAWRWRWRRRLWICEKEMLRECVTLLCSVSLQHDVTIYWRWELDPTEGYMVRGAYHLLVAHDTSLVHHTTELIWHKQVPLKVSVVAWR